MTPQEHELMLLMFARMRELIGILTDVLENRGLLTSDDRKAFSHAVPYDPVKTLNFVLQAWKDYQAAAAQAGLLTGLETGLPPKPTPSSEKPAQPGPLPGRAI